LTASSAVCNMAERLLLFERPFDLRLSARIVFSLSGMRNNRLHTGFAFCGIAAGVAVFIFFAGLLSGLDEAVFSRIFEELPESALRVTPGSLDIGFLGLSKPSFMPGAKIDEALLKKARMLKGAERVHASMNVAFPISVSGSLAGHRAASDLVASGIEPETAAEELKYPEEFSFSEDGEVPVLVNPTLPDLYNSIFAPMNGFPRLSPDMLIGFRFDLRLGRSYMGGRADKGKVRSVRCKLVGFSKHAVQMGITVPMEYVRRWNAEFSEEGERYHALYIESSDPTAAENIEKWFEKQGFNVQTQKEGASAAAGRLLHLLGAIFAALSLLIMTLAAVNLAFVQFIIVQRRRAAFATLRSMGATRADLAATVWLEALLLSIPAAAVGIAAALGLAHLSESILLSDLAGLPLRPDYLFRFPPLLLAAGFAYAALAALAGSLPPAWKAASSDPVKILKD